MEFNPKANLIMVDYWEKKRFSKRVNLELAKEALESILKFYPELRIILIADYSYENELNKTQHINLKFVHIPGLGDYPKIDDVGTGHGIGLDEGVKYVQTGYFFASDRDILMQKKGWLEKITSALSDEICAVGPGFSNKFTSFGKGRAFIAPQLSVFKTEPIRKFHLSFSNIFLKGLALSSGQFLCYRLAMLGYDFQDRNPREFREYIIHGRGER